MLRFLLYITMKSDKPKETHSHSSTMPIPAPLLYYAWFLFTTFHITSTSAETATYIVHMDLSAMPRAFAAHHHWYAATLSAAVNSATQEEASSVGALPKLVYAYDCVINGFSAALSPSQLEAIQKSHGFLSAYPDRPITLDTTRTPEFLHLNPVSGIWPASNYGKDVIIGVIDSGVWPESESFSDEGMTEIPARWKGECEKGTAFNSSMCNRKLIGARSFNKGLLTKHPDIVNISMNSTRDTDGHGTHTASTAAGNYVKGASFFGYAKGTASGIAPRARLAVYKVFWDEGGWESDYLAGMDQAIADGVDIISISMSFSPRPLYQDSFAIGSFAATKKGILVSLSAGNRGSNSVTVRNVAPWQLTVGATTLDRKFIGTVILGNGTTITGDSLFPGNSFLSNVPLIYNDTVKDCNSAVLDSVGYKVVVCGDGNSDLYEGDLRYQILFAANSRVAGGIFVSSRSELRSHTQFTFPAVVITAKDSATLREYAKQSSDPRVSLKFGQTLVGTKPAPYIAAYSSRGPSRICPTILKPDLVAPGSLVLAAYPPNIPAGLIGSRSIHTNFTLLYGTSMACPHAAGVAAMLKGIHPTWSPAAIRSAMMTTANVLDNTLNHIKDSGFVSYPRASPVDMGAGQIDPNKAADPGLIYDAVAADYERFLCTLNYTKEQYQIITRSSSYPCSSTSFEFNNPSFIAYFDPSHPSYRTIQEFPRTVTYVGNGPSVYRAKLTRIKGITVNVTPNKLVFKEKYEKLNYTLSLVLRRTMEDYNVHGSLSWVDNGAQHVVRSPIVAVRQVPNIDD